jgi:hypothetical protein
MSLAFFRGVQRPGGMSTYVQVYVVLFLVLCVILCPLYLLAQA